MNILCYVVGLVLGVYCQQPVAKLAQGGGWERGQTGLQKAKHLQPKRHFEDGLFEGSRADT